MSLFFLQYHIGFINVVFKLGLEAGSVSAPTLFFFNIILTFLSLLPLCKTLDSLCQYPEVYLLGLDWDYIESNWKELLILIILNLTVHKHVIFSISVKSSVFLSSELYCKLPHRFLHIFCQIIPNHFIFLY